MRPYVTEALSSYRSCEPARSLRNKATVADVRKYTYTHLIKVTL